MDIKINTNVDVNSDKVEIVAIVDRSGSMGIIRDDAVGAFNTFIDEQAKENIGEANLTVALFDDQYEIMQEGSSIREAVKFDANNYVPRGMTALMDAIGRTVNALIERKKRGEVDGAIIAILTDGHENSSHEYSKPQIKSLIETCEKEYGWTFVYLAANQDAMDVAKDYGMLNAVNFNASGDGIKIAAAAMSDYSTSYRNVRSTLVKNK